MSEVPEVTNPGSRFKGAKFTGTACSKCQGTERYNSTGGCVACAKAKAAAR